MAVLRDHQRVANGDHSDEDIHVASGIINSDSADFEQKKGECREMARSVRIAPGEVKIGNRGV